MSVTSRLKPPSFSCALPLKSDTSNLIHTMQITGLNLTLELVQLHDHTNNDNGLTVYRFPRKPVLLQKNRAPDFLQIYVNELE